MKEFDVSLFERGYELTIKKDLTSAEKEELELIKELQKNRKKKNTDTEYGYKPEDYGMCLSQWGWM